MFDVVTVSSGSSFVEYTFSAVGFPRLFENDGTYIYGLYGSFLRTEDAWINVTDMLPSDASSISAVCQTSGASTWGGEVMDEQYTTITVVAYTNSSGTQVAAYQKTPEVFHAWQDAGSLGSNFDPIDAIAGGLDSNPILIGNGLYTVSSVVKMLRDATPPPFGNWTQSDSGLPNSSTTSSITDLEVVGF